MIQTDPPGWLLLLLKEKKPKWKLKQVLKMFALLAIYTKELKSYVHTKSCTRIFIAALIVTAKTGKLPRCPSEDECVNKPWYIQTMGCYSGLKEISY